MERKAFFFDADVCSLNFKFNWLASSKRNVSRKKKHLLDNGNEARISTSSFPYWKHFGFNNASNWFLSFAEQIRNYASNCSLNRIFMCTLQLFWVANNKNGMQKLFCAKHAWNERGREREVIGNWVAKERMKENRFSSNAIA